jgi:hypothetical protein
VTNDVTWFKHILFLVGESEFIYLFISMLFKPQKLDIVLKRIEYDLSSASTIRYRRAEVPAKVLLSIDISKFISEAIKENIKIQAKIYIFSIFYGCQRNFLH